MIEFSVLKKSKKSRARLGVLKTSHGEVETPAIVGVATLAAIKGLRSEEVLKTKTQLLISNTYHLHLMPGENVVKKAGGINKFMNWPRPTMTDSGGFQVFSLGFGRDFGLGKVLKFHPGKIEHAIEKGSQPNNVRITRDGVHFRSPLSGAELFLGPKESMAIQEKLGADIMFAFDECTPTGNTHDYAKKSLELTNLWAKKCVDAKKSKQALFGIVQGSQFKDLRVQSAKFVNSLRGFEGFGIGGDLGESKTGTKQILDWVIPNLDDRKPRHLLGIGHIEDMEIIAQGGVDTFDCTVPTHYARRGIAFTSKGRVDLQKAALLKDRSPIDPACECIVCKGYRRDYVAHLIRAKEITGGALITFHNLFYFNTYVERIREKIRRGLI